MSQETDRFCIDKTVFRAMKIEDAANHRRFWIDKSMKERLDAAFYLIQQFYGTTPLTKIDMSVFSKRKHPHG